MAEPSRRLRGRALELRRRWWHLRQHSDSANSTERTRRADCYRCHRRLDRESGVPPQSRSGELRRHGDVQEQRRCHAPHRPGRRLSGPGRCRSGRTEPRRDAAEPERDEVPLHDSSVDGRQHQRQSRRRSPAVSATRMATGADVVHFIITVTTEGAEATRPARREEGKYREYLTDEQRPVGRMRSAADATVIMKWATKEASLLGPLASFLAQHRACSAPPVSGRQIYSSAIIAATDADVVLGLDRSGGARLCGWHHYRVRTPGVPAGTGRVLAWRCRISALCDCAQIDGASIVMRPAAVLRSSPRSRRRIRFRPASRLSIKRRKENGSLLLWRFAAAAIPRAGR